MTPWAKESLPLPAAILLFRSAPIRVVAGQQIVAVAYALTAVEADSASWSGLKGIPAGFADGTDNVGTGDITAVNTSGGLTGGATTGDANLSIAANGVTSSHISDARLSMPMFLLQPQ